MSMRPLSWACGHGTEMLLILKISIFDLIMPRYSQIWQSTILYAVNLWLKPVSATGTAHVPLYTWLRQHWLESERRLVFNTQNDVINRFQSGANSSCLSLAGAAWLYACKAKRPYLRTCNQILPFGFARQYVQCNTLAQWGGGGAGNSR